MEWVAAIGWLLAIMFTIAWGRASSIYHEVRSQLYAMNKASKRDLHHLKERALSAEKKLHDTCTDVHSLVTEPAGVCAVCRRLCDPKKDYCHGCGFHVCESCIEPETEVEHVLDDHARARFVVDVRPAPISEEEGEWIEGDSEEP